MTTSETTTRDLTPFFVDSRTVAEKLAADRRDWIPAKVELDTPSTIGGLVLERGSYTGFDKVSPTLILLDSGGVEWHLIAFHGFLRSAIERQAPRVGDWIALSYGGTKPAKKAGESEAHIYRLVVERNPDAPGLQAETPADPEPAESEDDDGDSIPF